MVFIQKVYLLVIVLRNPQIVRLDWCLIKFLAAKKFTISIYLNACDCCPNIGRVHLYNATIPI